MTLAYHNQPVLIGSTFSGYGGLDLAIERLFPNTKTVWHSEFERNPSRILAYRWPGVPNLGDITKIKWTPNCSTCQTPTTVVRSAALRVPQYYCGDCNHLFGTTLRDEDPQHWLIPTPVHMLGGGFPCQDVSAAGSRRGLKDGTRSGLWADFAAGIGALRPDFVFIENVRGLLSAFGEQPHAEYEQAVADKELWAGRVKELEDQIEKNREDADYVAGKLAETVRATKQRDRAIRAVQRESKLIRRAIDTVLRDLADLGYDARWRMLRAADIGAPHGRARIFILAYPTSIANRDSSGRTQHWGTIPVGTQHHSVEHTSDHATYPGGVRRESGRVPASTEASGGGTPSEFSGRGGEGNQTLTNPGPWLPTPVTTDGKPVDVANQVITRNSLSLQSIAALLGFPPETWESTDMSGNMDRQVGEGAKRRALVEENQKLPTPTVNDMGEGKSIGQWDGWTHKMRLAHNNSNGHGPSLAIEALRMAEHKNLPTPRASDGDKGGPNQRGSAGDLMLPSAVHQIGGHETVARLATPNTMDYLPARAGEAREKQLRRGNPDGVRREAAGNLREDILHITPPQEAGQDVHDRSWFLPASPGTITAWVFEDDGEDGLFSFGVSDEHVTPQAGQVNWDLFNTDYHHYNTTGRALYTPHEGFGTTIWVAPANENQFEAWFTETSAPTHHNTPYLGWQHLHLGVFEASTPEQALEAAKTLVDAHITHNGDQFTDRTPASDVLFIIDTTPLPPGPHADEPVTGPALGDGERLPTPKASDGLMGLPRTSGRSPSRATHLATRVAYDTGAHQALVGSSRSDEDLLRTPVASEADGGPIHPDTAKQKRQTLKLSGQTLAATGNLRSPVHGSLSHSWGKYAPAIQLWETLTRPAPSPVELSVKGNPQLSPKFVEWMMGLEAGWVTDKNIWVHALLTKRITVAGVRIAELKALGNGVVPPQAYTAYRIMLIELFNEIVAERHAHQVLGAAH